MSRAASFRFWRINIISKIYRTFHILFIEENYFAIIIVIELSPSPSIYEQGMAMFMGSYQTVKKHDLIIAEIAYRIHKN